MLSFVFNGKLGIEDFLLVPDEACKHFAIEGINEPDHQVFSACNEHRSLVVPLDEVQVLLGDIVQSPLQRKVVLDVPDAKQIVHSTSDKPLATCVKLAELNCLSMSG